MLTNLQVESIFGKANWKMVWVFWLVRVVRIVKVVMVV